MRVTEVQALVKYSTEIKGSWVAIELGGTASLTDVEETLESVSAELYQRLTKQLKALWANNKAGGSETQAEALNAVKGKRRVRPLTRTGVLSTTLSSSSSTRTVTRGSVTRLLMEPGITGGADEDKVIIRG
jgi:hypothetical protein